MTTVSAAPIPHIALAAGGTGGHIAPALALAEALRQLDPRVELSCLCGDKPFEARMYRTAGYEPLIVGSRPFTVGDPIKMVRAMGAFGGAFLRLRRHFAAHRPSVVVGMGGYVAAPALMAAASLRIPTYLHEQNAIPGRANRLLSYFSTQTSAAHVTALEMLHGRGRRMLGNPLPKRLFEAARDDGYSVFGLSPERPVLLVLGGSQGAERLNELVFEVGMKMAKKLPVELLPQFLWAAGEKHADRWRVHSHTCGAPVGLFHIAPFIERMPEAYAAADLAIARAGAGTIAELTAAGLPSLLVPYPFARDDHQRANAKALVDSGAAILEIEASLTPTLLAARIEQLLFHPDRLRRMSAAARALAHPDAAWRMARAVLSLGEPRLSPAPEAVPAPAATRAVPVSSH